MNNKKLLSLALAGVMITAMPFNVFADEKEGAPEDKTPVEESAGEIATGEENPSVQDTEEVTVTFDSDGGSKVAVQTIEKGKTAKAPAAPTKEGKEFVEWQKDGKKFDFSTPVNENVTLKAVWKDKVTEKVTVTFDSDGGSKVAVQTIEKGKTAKAPAAPTKEGKEFVEWQKDGKKFDFSTPVNENVTLKAVWKDKVTEKVTVTFDSDGGSKVAVQTIEKGKTAKAPAAPTKEGKEFVEWQKDGKKFDFSTPVNENVTLKAVWKDKVAEKVTVTFDSDGGSKVAVQTIEKGKTAKAPAAPTKEGKEFVEWQKDGKKFDFSTPVNENVTLKAVWKDKVTEKVTVTFDSDGGSEVAVQTIEKGKTAKTPAAPTKKGYKFKGWYDGDTKFDFDEVITTNKVLTAKWEKEESSEPVSRELSISERHIRNGRFYGEVTSDGDAVEGATVTLYDYDGDKTGKSTTTDEDGYFDIYIGYDYGYDDDDDYYYNGYRYYRDGDSWYYYRNGKKYWTDYRPSRSRRSRRYYDGYLKAEKSGYESDKYELDGYYSNGRNYRYDRFDRYYKDDYDKRVYPTDISRTKYSTKGYLKGYTNTRVYVYDGDDYLGSDTTDSDGYFRVTWDSPSISTSRSLEYYVYGSKYSTNNGYSIIPTINTVSAGAKYVRGNAGANADVTIYDSNGVKLGSATAGDTGIYNVTLNRELKAGETIKVESKESDKVAKTAEYKVEGTSVDTDAEKQVGYIAGFPDGTFKPEKEVTRAEAVRMFVTLVNDGKEVSKNSKTDFKDANDAWYSDEINFAVSKGFIKGYSDNTFKPNNSITRAEFAQMISVFVKDGYPGTGSFKDVKGHWASDAINELYGNKIVSGYKDGTFKPDQKLTRAEAVTILNSVFGRNTKSSSLSDVNESSLKKFTDVSKSHWAYYEILDASNGHKASKSGDSSVWK